MVTVEPLAKGIWWLAGGSHHSVLVEFADHLTLIEAPLNEARALAVIAKARELVPGKPLTQLVNSHHHFDHSGGVRAAISEGLTVITHQGNVAFFQEMAKRRAHAAARRAVEVRQAGDGRRRGRAAHADGSDDDGEPDRRVGPALADDAGGALSRRRSCSSRWTSTRPAAPCRCSPAGSSRSSRSASCAIDRVVPLHGTIAPYAQFVKEASAPVPVS